MAKIFSPNQCLEAVFAEIKEIGEDKLIIPDKLIIEEDGEWSANFCALDAKQGLDQVKEEIRDLSGSKQAITSFYWLPADSEDQEYNFEFDLVVSLPSLRGLQCRRFLLVWLPEEKRFAASMLDFWKTDEWSMTGQLVWTSEDVNLELNHWQETQLTIKIQGQSTYWENIENIFKNFRTYKRLQSYAPLLPLYSAMGAEYRLEQNLSVLNNKKLNEWWKEKKEEDTSLYNPKDGLLLCDLPESVRNSVLSSTDPIGEGVFAELTSPVRATFKTVIQKGKNSTWSKDKIEVSNALQSFLPLVDLEGFSEKVEAALFEQIMAQLTAICRKIDWDDQKHLRLVDVGKYCEERVKKCEENE